MSAHIQKEHKALRHSERTQKPTMDITPWMEWFLGCFVAPLEGSTCHLGAVSSKRASGRASSDTESTTTVSRLVIKPACATVRRQTHNLEIAPPPNAPRNAYSDNLDLI